MVLVLFILSDDAVYLYQVSRRVSGYFQHKNLEGKLYNVMPMLTPPSE